MTVKLLIYIVAYKAEKHIAEVLNKIPYENLKNYEVLVSDDCSDDRTWQVVEDYQKKYPQKNIKFFTQKRNLGYGGNQKFGYNYAIENAFDLVVLIHGDGQYSPELIPQMIDSIILQDVDVVLGSRMLNKKSALQGGMPFYKFVGNIILTKLQNIILGQKLSEYHTGLRAYKISALRQIKFQYNDDGFSFDTDILIQLIDRKSKIFEVAIPTYYGDEICRVNGVKYACEILLSTLIFRLCKWKIFKSKKFNFRI